MKNPPTFELPTIPYDLIAAINRAAAATGSVGYAMATAHANYNGHRVSVVFNDYRQYWITEHFWGERVVHFRGGFQGALEAGKAEYAIGALGTQVVANWSPQKDNSVSLEQFREYALKLGYIETDFDSVQKLPPFWNWKYSLTYQAVKLNASHHLIEATSEEDFWKRVYPTKK